MCIKLLFKMTETKATIYDTSTGGSWQPHSVEHFKQTGCKSIKHFNAYYNSSSCMCANLYAIFKQN